ncbi:uncharacterized protein LOC117585182 [Drosophila guanche]|uniref:Blast:Leucine-rich repeat-containing protein 9 n=1 Tax=Drosophila guanche TaxID=7266 RepID=A0A3B0J1P9_DROGU|nr:uncharacterized protein LOC117585182 [Drosophila guanche]SPP72763.1 blast:Leucine-rich repeat-containing protein 9 [Drosophila guanche]
MAHFVHNPSEQNYYFKNSIAYTEDHIPVQKLYVFKIPIELNKTMLYSHFSNYGRILHMQLSGNNSGRRVIGRSNRFQYKTGWVFYEKTLDAAKPLHSRIHHVNGLRFNVQASDSWHQPDAYGADACSYAQEAEAEQLYPPILNLNDHCLEMVMRYLPMHEQMVFARTCLRFRAVYQQATSRLHKSINLNDFEKLTVWDLREFFKLSGTYVQHITGVIPPMRSQRFYEFLSANCLNLKTLTLHNSPLTPRNMVKIFAKMTKLEVLELPQNMLTDEGISALENCRSLKTLNIAGNPIIGASLVKLSPTIESLTLSDCRRFQGQHLSNICKVFTNLKTLNLNIDTMSFNVFQTMIKENSGASLEVLRISAVETFEYVAQLPNLKSLTIYISLPCRTLRLELFQQLAEHKAEKLERLEVCGGSGLSPGIFPQIAKLRGLRTLILPDIRAMSDNDLTTFSSLKMLEQINLKYSHLHDSSVFFLFDSCPKLHTLCLDNCECITEKLVHGIIKKLRADIDNKENQRSLPVQLCVSETKINTLIKHHPDVKPKDILEVKHYCDCHYESSVGFRGFDVELDDLGDLGDLGDQDEDVDSDVESDDYSDDDFGFISSDDLEDPDNEIGYHPPGWSFMSA